MSPIIPCPFTPRFSFSILRLRVVRAGQSWLTLNPDLDQRVYQSQYICVLT
jgi:hypothetical protein